MGLRILCYADFTPFVRLAGPQFPHLYNGENNIYLEMLLSGLDRTL